MNNDKKISRIAYSSAFIVLTLSLLHFSLNKDNRINNNKIIIETTEETSIDNIEEMSLSVISEEISESSEVSIENESNEELILEPIEEPIEEIIVEEDNRKLVALTFDDGPCNCTSELIDLLDEYDVKATFFVLKSNCEKYPDQLAKISDSGHEIAIHGATHTSFNKLSNSQVKEEILSTINYIEELNLKASPVVRPPYGSYSKKLLAETEYPFILWNIDTRDWENHNKDKIKKLILDNINDGCIILMHDRKDVHNCDVEALKEILPELIEEYKFVTVSELAESYETELEAGNTYRLVKNTKENKN